MAELRAEVRCRDDGGIQQHAEDRPVLEEAGRTPDDLSDDPRNRWKRGLRAVSGALVDTPNDHFIDFGGVGHT